MVIAFGKRRLALLGSVSCEMWARLFMGRSRIGGRRVTAGNVVTVASRSEGMHPYEDGIGAGRGRRN